MRQLSVRRRRPLASAMISFDENASRPWQSTSVTKVPIRAEIRPVPYPPRSLTESSAETNWRASCGVCSIGGQYNLILFLYWLARAGRAAKSHGTPQSKWDDDQYHTSSLAKLGAVSISLMRSNKVQMTYDLRKTTTSVRATEDCLQPFQSQPQHRFEYCTCLHAAKNQKTPSYRRVMCQSSEIRRMIMNMYDAKLRSRHERNQNPFPLSIPHTQHISIS